MSETVATVIKLLSGLTSPKAAIKYICIGFGVVLSWRYLHETELIAAMPSEQKSLALILCGVGGGSIVGHLISTVYGYVEKLCIQKIEESKQKKKETAVREEAAKKMAQDNSAVLKNYLRSFPFMHYKQKDELRALTNGNKSLDLSDSHFRTLLDNCFIFAVAKISSDYYVVTLNPVLLDETRNSWEAEISKNVDDFFREMTPEKERVLELLEWRDDDAEDISPITFDVKPVVRPYYSSISIQAESGEGFWLCFRNHHLLEYKKRTGKEYRDEVWITKDRITLLDN